GPGGISVSGSVSGDGCYIPASAVCPGCHSSQISIFLRGPCHHRSVCHPWSFCG
ncbi:hypothetical protein M9458_006699, partial [Cirrhinus mrigala]